MEQKEINLDTLFANKHAEPTETVLVVKEQKYVDFGRILDEVSYKLPKGYPTIVDGVFTEREEIIIINEALEAEGLSTLPLPEAERQKKIIQPTDFALWMKSISAVERTKFFELIPIVQALNKSQRITTADIIAVINKNKNQDWGDAADGVVKKLEFFLTKSKNTIDYLDNYYLAGKIKNISPINPSYGMTNIYGGAPASSFIWANIELFYNIVKQVDKQENKVFAADVILFWGVKDPLSENVMEKIKKAVANPKRLSKYPSVVEIGKGEYMACVSLKAGAGRLGKLTSYFNNFLPKDMQEQELVNLDEGLADIWKNIKGKVLDYWERAKDFLTNMVSSVKKAFSPSSPEIGLANNVSKDLVNLNNLIDSAGTGTADMSEGVEDDIVCDVCMRDVIADMNKKFLPDYIKGKAFTEFSRLMLDYSKDSSFTYKFNALDNKKNEIAKASLAVSKLVSSVLKAQQVKTLVFGKSGKNPIKCQPLAIKKIPRSSFKDILFISANQNAIETITNMLKSSFPKGLPKKDSMQQFLKIATNLNAQSIFGKSGSIPLVKFTGQEPPIQLGNKAEYVEYKTKELGKYTNKLSKFQLPVVGLFISPSSGRLKSDNPYYYNITLYTLYNIKPSEDGTINAKSFEYATISLKCNSGSGFTFVVEGDGIANGNILLKNLNTK